MLSTELGQPGLVGVRWEGDNACSPEADDASEAPPEFTCPPCRAAAMESTSSKKMMDGAQALAAANIPYKETPWPRVWLFPFQVNSALILDCLAAVSFSFHKSNSGVATPKSYVQSSYRRPDWRHFVMTQL